MRPDAFFQDRFRCAPRSVGATIAGRHAQKEPAILFLDQTEVPAFAGVALIFGDDCAVIGQIIGTHPKGDGALRDLERVVMGQIGVLIFAVEGQRRGARAGAISGICCPQDRLVFVKGIGLYSAQLAPVICIGAGVAGAQRPKAQSAGQAIRLWRQVGRDDIVAICAGFHLALAVHKPKLIKRITGQFNVIGFGWAGCIYGDLVQIGIVHQVQGVAFGRCEHLAFAAVVIAVMGDAALFQHLRLAHLVQRLGHIRVVFDDAIGHAIVGLDVVHIHQIAIDKEHTQKVAVMRAAIAVLERDDRHDAFQIAIVVEVDIIDLHIGRVADYGDVVFIFIVVDKVVEAGQVHPMRVLKVVFARDFVPLDRAIGLGVFFDDRLDRVDLRCDQHGVAACAADDNVIADQRLVFIAIKLVEFRVHIAVCGACFGYDIALCDLLLAPVRAGDNQVIAQATNKDVRAIAAIEVVVAVTTIDRIITITAQDHVVAVARVHRVVAAQRVDLVDAIGAVDLLGVIQRQQPQRVRGVVGVNIQQRNIRRRVGKVRHGRIKRALIHRQSVDFHPQRHAAATVEILHVEEVEPAVKLGADRGGLRGAHAFEGGHLDTAQ